VASYQIEGFFKDGNLNGVGMTTREDGLRCVGDHVDGKLEGRGYYKSADGAEMFGNFKGGMFIGVNEEMNSTDVEVFIKEYEEKIEESKKYVESGYELTI